MLILPPKISKLEEKAIKLLLKYEDKGLLQSELWHKLGVTSREGSRIAIKLEKKGIVKRVKEFAKDRWTRRLVPLIRQVTLEPIKGAPCPSCIYNNVCGKQGTVSPNTCVWIEEWLISSYSSSKNIEENQA
ncbi:MAG: Lrp/AsnC family transcriptional regulator [Thaumarchaeota archaeon]|nr:Lrp/AsnC family transcriptional regulator [Candidatus Geocrenenecus arthurdayi]MCL7388999.1 Lrp/AsnC family transcriptional regulator [Candidatus Geocrenenecus arthurdayi]MCL7391107.1 Lrp/AsnC family transcriptional regulator [Candidatus Geocrenenecus arthurdayi]MCL7396265.1 Lrp/AsnC family transcriptional regulator [Candidatus Geocrenenecus arthurdayi]MCL7401377.1 Lrp/AsnC family transcriptional regulator [Candidatus Geocrenenecus arthurdayi]